MQVVESHDPDLILSFMKGPGITRKCLGGYEMIGGDLRSGILTCLGTFLVAVDGDAPRGFIMLYPEGSGSYSIHLCLHTVGAKTKEAFALALEYAKNILHASEIKAYFPATYRACLQITAFFGFSDDESTFPTPVPYVFKRLPLV